MLEENPEFESFLKSQPEFIKLQNRFNKLKNQKKLPIDVFELKRRNINEIEKVCSISETGEISLSEIPGQIHFICKKNKCLMFRSDRPNSKNPDLFGQFDNIEFGTAKSLRSKDSLEGSSIFIDEDNKDTSKIHLMMFEFLSII